MTFSSILIIACTLLSAELSAQENYFDVQDILPEAMKENVTVHPLCSDHNESTFLIWVKDTVKPHYHARHTELIYVTQGAGTFYLGDQIYELKPGDFVRIPQGVIHSYKSKSKEASKVISVQTPEFKGEDRVWVETQK